jgi:hypothetical protein
LRLFQNCKSYQPKNKFSGNFSGILRYSPHKTEFDNSGLTMGKNAKLAILKFAVIFFLRKIIIRFYLPNNIFTQNSFFSDCLSNFFRKVVVYISFYTFFPVVSRNLSLICNKFVLWTGFRVQSSGQRCKKYSNIHTPTSCILSEHRDVLKWEGQ